MTDAAPFPIFLTLARSGHAAGVLIVGEDGEAAGKLRLAARTGARCVVVSDEPDAHLLEAVEQCGAELRRRAFEPGDLTGMRLCFVALADVAACAAIVAEARAHGVLVNAVDKPELCDFIVPAIVDRPPITVAISTGGTAPILARELRRRIEAMVPPGYGPLARFLNGWRDRVMGLIPDVLHRRRFWEASLDSPAAELVLNGDMAGAETAMAAHLAAHATPGAPIPQGRASLVGAGPGDPELMTLKAMRTIQGADVILYDRLIDQRILDLARRGARRIDVGKRCGQHVMSQEAISRLIIAQARRGDHVVRLKGGDPFIFGRGGEEVAELQAAGLQVEIVPGVTAACAAAARLGVPLTHREVAHSLHLVTAHGRDGGLPDLDWPALVRVQGTIAVYMGRRNLGAFAARLIEAGLPGSTPAAAIENATLPDEWAIRASLADLAQAMADPARDGATLVLIGAVLGLAATQPLSSETGSHAA